jgi:hypothetical protein
VVTKQTADDASNAYRALTEEFKAFTDKLRGSTEWKLLSIRAPEECKQLGVRLSVLMNEKEKREASSAGPLHERIELYKKRADAECARRKALHAAEVDPPRAASAEDEWRQVQLRCKQKRERIASQQLGGGGGGGVGFGHRKQPIELVEEYVAAAKKDVVVFSTFYELYYPSVDS